MTATDFRRHGPPPRLGRGDAVRDCLTENRYGTVENVSEEGLQATVLWNDGRRELRSRELIARCARASDA